MFRKKRSRSLIYILFFFVFALSINRFFVPFSDIIKHSYSVILYPVFLSQEYLVNPVKKVFRARRTRQELEQLVFKLNRTCDSIAAENINLRATVSYYNQIKEVLEFRKRYNVENLHFCKILFKHINKNSHFIYIDKGLSNGIKNDMVAVYNNFLLGKVVETYEFYSKVLLITDQSCKVSAYCEKTGANGINEGVNLPDQMALNRISHLEQVELDDLVLSSGHGLVFPQGFALGRVIEVQKGDLYNTVKVAPMFDIKNISYCYLLKKGDYKGQVYQVEPVAPVGAELVNVIENSSAVDSIKPAVISVEPVVNSKQAAKQEPTINAEPAAKAKKFVRVKQVVKVEQAENSDLAISAVPVAQDKSAVQVASAEQAVSVSENSGSVNQVDKVEQ